MTMIALLGTLLLAVIGLVVWANVRLTCLTAEQHREVEADMRIW
jgi:hypothetical protein